MKKLAIASILINLFAICAFTQTTEFTFQGNLKDGTNPANANYDFEFALYDSLSAGTQLGSTLSRNAVVVSNGSFAVKLDFGSQFTGANRFLEIRVRLSGQPGMTTLSPRQQISNAPYAVRSLNAANADNATTAANVSGVVPIANGGTGSATKNFVDLSTDQTNVGGNKTFTGDLTVNGNVGIGMATPQQRLSVSDGMNIDQNNLNSGTLTNTMRFGPGNSGEAIGSKRTAGGNLWGLDFYTASSNRMSITSAGNVGIGTITPSSKLEVNGDVKVTGTVTGPRTNMNLSTGSITPGGTSTLVPGLSQTVVVSGNAKLLVQFGVGAWRGSCFGCNANNAYLEVTLNGNTAHLVSATSVAPNTNVYLSGSWLMSVGQGSHTVQIKARTNEGSITYGCGCVEPSHLIVQVIPE